MEPISSHAYKTITNLETSRQAHSNDEPVGKEAGILDKDAYKGRILRSGLRLDTG